MTTLREAAQQALEALERIDQADNDCDFLNPSQCYQLDAAMTALRAALAEPVQEPLTCDECGRKKADGWALYCVDCLEPMFAQRKPLTEEEIIDLWEGVSDPESPEISMINFSRAIERAHGIGGSHV